VKACVFELFGAFARFHHENIDQKDLSVIKRKFLNIFSAISKNPELDLIAGVISGLSDYLYVHTLSPGMYFNFLCYLFKSFFNF
jgi:hypothetical protein